MRLLPCSQHTTLALAIEKINYFYNFYIFPIENGGFPLLCLFIQKSQYFISGAIFQVGNWMCQHAAANNTMGQLAKVPSYIIHPVPASRSHRSRRFIYTSLDLRDMNCWRWNLPSVNSSPEQVAPHWKKLPIDLSSSGNWCLNIFQHFSHGKEWYLISKSSSSCFWSSTFHF